MAQDYYYPRYYEHTGESLATQYTSRRNRRKSKKILTRFFVVLVLIVGILFIIDRTIPQNQNKQLSILSPLVDPIRDSLQRVNTALFSTELENVVDASLEGTKGDYAVVIKNLKTGEQYYRNEHERYLSASLYKLWVMGTVYEQIDKGVLGIDDTVSGNVESLNKQFGIASEEAELTEGSFKYTVKEAVEQMITISHNYAALTLSSKVKQANIKEFLQTYALDDTKTTSPPTTTAFDIAFLYEQLYKGNIVSSDYSSTMLETLKRQKMNDRIPKYLPEEITVAHKTGELYGYKHDAGIVYTPHGDYIIVMMSNSNNPQSASERMALLSKDVYEYFSKKTVD